MSAVVADPGADRGDGRLLVRPSALGRRRPVRTFVGVLAAACLVLLAVARSGVAAPQASLRFDHGLGDGTTRCGTAYVVVNQGLRPLEVEGATWGPVAPITVPGGSRRGVEAWHPCVGADLSHHAVHVRSTDLGLRATLHPA